MILHEYLIQCALKICNKIFVSFPIAKYKNVSICILKFVFFSCWITKNEIICMFALFQYFKLPGFKIGPNLKIKEQRHEEEEEDEEVEWIFDYTLPPYLESEGEEDEEEEEEEEYQPKKGKLDEYEMEKTEEVHV